MEQERIKTVLLEALQWEKLTDQEREAIEQVFDKMEMVAWWFVWPRAFELNYHKALKEVNKKILPK